MKYVSVDGLDISAVHVNSFSNSQVPYDHILDFKNALIIADSMIRNSSNNLACESSQLECCIKDVKERLFIHA